MRLFTHCIPLLLAATLAGCASTPPASPRASVSSNLDCRQLGAEIAKTEEAKRAALAKQQGAWKVVLPFAVVGRYASGKSAAERADQRLAQLRADFKAQGCSHGI